MALMPELKNFVKFLSEAEGIEITKKVPGEDQRIAKDDELDKLIETYSETFSTQQHPHVEFTVSIPKYPDEEDKIFRTLSDALEHAIQTSIELETETMVEIIIYTKEGAIWYAKEDGQDYEPTGESVVFEKFMVNGKFIV